MSEQLQLQTPDFEFSVWVNDISSRAQMYQDAVLKRARSALDDEKINNDAAYELRFSPALQLEEISTGDGNGLGLKNTLALKSPFFFENTQYQFEWIFLNSVSNAYIAHKSQNLNEAFRFSPESKTSRGIIPARLTGTINTGNDVGWMRLPIFFEIQGKKYSQHIAFEVLPTKMALHQDLPAMYQAIDKIYPLWRFSLVEKTEQGVAANNKQRNHFPLMWLANFSALRERFEQGLKVICEAPHRRLQSQVTNNKAAQLKGRLSYRLAEQIKQDFACGQYEKRYLVEKKKLSVDTPENRFIKRVVSQSKLQLAEFEARLRSSNKAPENQRLSDYFLDELHSWKKPLQKILNQSFLQDVGVYSGLSRESLVLQQKTGYSTIYRIWHELKFYLDVLGNQSSISMKSVAEIYEVWCFICLKQILEQDLGFTMVESSVSKLSKNEFFEYQLKDGFAGAFRFERADGVSARLAHEPKFTKKGQSIRSYLVNQEPDIVLEITLPESDQITDKKQFIWLFDAKYRIKTDKNRFDSNEDNIDGIDYVPDDAINQMHRYRDALIRLSNASHSAPSKNTKKSRPVFGAFALYPGFFDQTKELNPYADAIEEVGIGAFALLPSHSENNYCGHLWLLKFLQDQIGVLSHSQTDLLGGTTYPVAELAEQLYVQDAARIPYAGMQQVLYPDLTMTTVLGGQQGRIPSYFDAFKQGTARWYHMPQETFLSKFKQHIAAEIRYLALAITSPSQSNTKQIDKIWPVKSVLVLPRYAITEEQAGRKSSSNDLYYLFELGRPLTLQNTVSNVPHRPVKNSMKLTTLSCLENVKYFTEIKKVYENALT
jgi:hypothetical protein